MNRRGYRWGCLGLALALALRAAPVAAQTFRIATYNVENYLDRPTETRPHVKSAAARAKVCESIRALNPDVIALQEMGEISALQELRAALKARGLDFGYWEHVSAFDTNIHIAILSKFPFSARRPHTNDDYLLGRSRFFIRHGIAEVDVRLNPGYSFTLIAAHLKSKRAVPGADQAEERLQEAKILRRIVDADLAANPDARVVVLGDFNDSKDSPAIKAIIGRGRRKLVDTRPSERNGDRAPNPPFEPRTITWTHYYGKEDSYSRFDYILLSPGMAREWVAGETYVLALPDWGVASDHRPIVAAFRAENP